MSDNKEKLQDALGMLDDDLLLEVEKLRRMPQKRRSFQWHRLGAIAACLCVLVGSVFAGRWIKLGSRPESADYLTADGLETAAVLLVSPSNLSKLSTSISSASSVVVSSSIASSVAFSVFFSAAPSVAVSKPSAVK